MGKTKVTFQKGDIVQHVRTRYKYRIVLTPDQFKLEATNEPAYLYKAFKKPYWNWARAAILMEDGRFTLTYRKDRDGAIHVDPETKISLYCTECSNVFEYDVETLMEDIPRECTLCGGEWADGTTGKRRKK